jgi:hypothetical protein
LAIFDNSLLLLILLALFSVINSYNKNFSVDKVTVNLSSHKAAILDLNYASKFKL